MSEPLELHIPIDKTDLIAVEVLSEQSGLSKQKVKQLMQKGAVWLTKGQHTQRLRRAKKTLQLGDELHLYYNESVIEQEPTPAQLIADEVDYSIWYKPYGMHSQGSKWGDHCSIGRWVEQHLEPQRNAFVVHRLDRAASGLILIAHSKKVANSLSALFAKRQINKCYQAVVEGIVEAEPIAVTEPVDEKKAISHIQCLDTDVPKNRSLVAIKIETGRKHQIRKHLAHLGYPIVGDRLYGNADELDLQLTAVSLSFTCPLSGQIKQYELDKALKPRL